jgi:sigma-E factor negative regulatory protein RseA
MSDERLIQLSALADSALDDQGVDALRGALAEDPGLRERWERYHLIRQSIRREPISPGARVIADRVAAALATEPDNLIRLTPRRRARSGVAAFAGAALAAAAAFLAVFAIPGLFHWVDEGGVVAESRVAAQGVPRAVLAGPVPASGPAIWKEHPELATKLNLYLLNHQESAPAAGVRGVLPYVSFVAHDAP